MTVRESLQLYSILLLLCVFNHTQSSQHNFCSFSVLNHMVSFLQLYSCFKNDSTIPDPLYFQINVINSLAIVYKKATVMKTVIIMSIKHFKEFCMNSNTSAIHNTHSFTQYTISIWNTMSIFLQRDKRASWSLDRLNFSNVNWDLLYQEYNTTKAVFSCYLI